MVGTSSSEGRLRRQQQRLVLLPKNRERVESKHRKPLCVYASGQCKVKAVFSSRRHEGDSRLVQESDRRMSYFDTPGLYIEIHTGRPGALVGTHAAD